MGALRSRYKRISSFLVETQHQPVVPRADANSSGNTIPSQSLWSQHRDTSEYDIANGHY